MKAMLGKDFDFRISSDTQYRFRAGVVVDGVVAEAAIAAGAARAPNAKKNPTPQVIKPARPSHEG